MKSPTEKLLDDMLEETASAEFRAELMDRTLGQARRRKRVRRFGVGLGGAVAVAAAVVLLLVLRPEPTAPTYAVRPPDLIVLSSQPLKASETVSTAGHSLNVVATADWDSSVVLVQTHVAERVYVEIDDKQLFTLLTGKPIALMQRGPNAAELIFLDPNDRKELMP